MTGWLWPLTGVQYWFEDLWRWIGEASTLAVSAVSTWIDNAVTGIFARVQDVGSWIVERVAALVSGLYSGMGDISGIIYNVLSFDLQRIFEGLGGLAGLLGEAVSSAVSGLFSSLQDMGGWITESIWGWVDGALRWASDSFLWLSNVVTETGSSIVSDITSNIGEAFGGVFEVFAGWPAALSEAIGNAFIPLLRGLGAQVDTSHSMVVYYPSGVPGLDYPQVGWLEGVIGKGLESGFRWILDAIEWITTTIAGVMTAVQKAISPVITPILSTLIETATAAVTPGSPDKEIEKATQEFSTGLLKKIQSLIPEHKSPLPELSVLLAASAGVVGMNMLTVFGMGSVATYLDLAHPIKMTGIMTMASDMLNSLAFPAMIGPILFSNIYAGIIIPLRYRWNELYTHMLPPAPDLIRMVVREAFDPKAVIPAPKVFAANMKYHGFAQEWSDRYWTAHFMPIGLSQAYANLHRGRWDKEQFMYALHIADIHPMWREDIFAVAYRAPTVREMGYGFDTGEYTVADIVRYRMWGGLSRADAEKAGRAMVAYRTETEREALRREALADFVAYLDTEDTLRKKLASIGGRPELVDLWVSRAIYRRDRDMILDLAKDSVNQFVKGWITEEELRNDLRDLNIIAEGRENMISTAATRKLKYVRESTVEKKKEIPVSRVRKARDLGLIGDSEYVRRLIDHNYTAEDARLDLLIELTPRPVTPEEVERRQMTITSRLERARRRWELRLTKIQDQIDLAAIQRDDTTNIMSEALDVTDTQIKIIDDSIPLVSPENAKALLEKRLVLEQRRELTEARFTARISKLVEQHTDLLETKTLYVVHRDEELGEYEDELALLGGVAG